MRHKGEQLPEDTAHEILELAARYYTESTHQEQVKGYTIEELIDAGTEAQIPDEYIQQAIKDIEAKSFNEQRAKPRSNQPKKGLKVIAVNLTLVWGVIISASVAAKPCPT
ncbi:MAG: hypothetical protein AAFR62_15735 [Cyanobacteria bacterium J06629_2]